MKTKKELKQKRGIALLVGVNKLSEAHYGSISPKSNSIERDVADIEMMVRLGGMESKTILSEQATRLQILSAISKVAKSLKPEDTFLLYFSGFGGNIANFAGIDSQPLCPTWCLFDSQILIAEIKSSLSLFQTGVDVLIISDCSSSIEMNWTMGNPNATPRILQKEILDTVYLTNKDFYDAKNLAHISSNALNANIIWLKSCQPNQISYENENNGYMTSCIKHLWNGGLYSKKYNQFMQEVTMLMPPYQSPSIEIIAGTTTGLFAKKPFIA